MSRFPTTPAPLVTFLVALGLALPVLSLDAQSLPAAPVYPEATNTKRLPLKKLAPDFTRSDLTGKSIRLSSYRGKVVLLNFWATWCEPCLAEIPRFSAWQQKYAAEGLQILGVAMDDDSTPVKRAVLKDQLAYPVVMGDEHLGELYGGVLGLPLSYIIDPAGRIVARYQGEPDLTPLELRIKALLPGRRR